MSLYDVYIIHYIHLVFNVFYCLSNNFFQFCGLRVHVNSQTIHTFVKRKHFTKIFYKRNMFKILNKEVNIM